MAYYYWLLLWHTGLQYEYCSSILSSYCILYLNIASTSPISTPIQTIQLIDSNVRVKCLGGRELRGALRGYDELVNLVLDDCEEFLRGALYNNSTDEESYEYCSVLFDSFLTPCHSLTNNANINYSLNACLNCNHYQPNIS